jgi:hypothetical protein
MGRLLKIVIDHLDGSRRGQRDELEPLERVRFGRHPEGEVVFDAKRDLDASTRHAELRREGDQEGGYVLHDVGSSNGTFIDGERITSRPLRPGEPMTVDFGEGGPRLRLFVCDEAHPEVPAIPPTARHEGRPRWVLGIAALLVVIAALALILLR